MPTYYEIDSTRATFREYLFETKNPITLLLAFILKILRVRMPGSSDDANVDSTLECIVPNLPPEIEARFAPLTATLTSQGYVDPVYHFFMDHTTQTRLYWATYRHVSGRQCARIHHRYWEKAQKKDRGTFLLFITPFSDGTFLVSSAGKPDVIAPDTVRMNRMPDATFERLGTEHERQVNAALSQKAIQPVSSQGDLVAMTERLHLLQRDFHLGRKFFRVRTSEEQATADAFISQVEQARSVGMQYPEIMAELTRLQEKKPRWTSALWVLVLSALGFVAAGAANWSWKVTLWLIPVLLFHEFGHWLAMRLFNYRNLRMFFIPFFGAAVTGQNWNVPGWKKALVSLAGPLPGIMLGTVLGVTAMVMDILFLKQAALMLILLNAFNLLPVLPLDGGHFLHSVLFCRNRWLDILFRVVAVVGLLLLSIYGGGGKILMYIAIVLAIALPVAFKMAKITDHFRNQPLPSPSPNEDRIPPETAQVLIGAVKEQLPQNTSNAIVAQHTLNVFETLNARPPNALASIGLLAIYGGSVFVSIVCAAFLLISRDGGISDFLGAAIRQPQHSVNCTGSEVWRGDKALGTGTVNLIVSTFPKQSEARSNFGEMKSRIPDDASLTLFGDSLLLALPSADDAARERWFVEMQARSTNTFVVVSNNAVSLSLAFLAPDSTVATNLEYDLNDYFQSPNPDNLIPPWSAQATGKEFESYRQARRIWVEMRQEMNGVWTNSTLRDYSSRILAANRRGARADAKRLEEEQQKQAEQLENEARQRLQTKYESTPFIELVKLESELSEINYTNRTEREGVLRRISPHLGQIEHSSRERYGSGSASRHGLIIEAPWITLRRPAENLPVILNWLCQKGCVEVKYSFHDYFGMDPDLDE